jgi:hypothetical protein
MSADQGGTPFLRAIARLGDIKAQRDTEIQEIIDARDKVIARYRPMFSQIPQLTDEARKDFLPFKSNHHWTNLHRQSGRICQDMGGLRRGLLALCDDAQPIETRWNAARRKWCGKAILSAVLLVRYPNKYGVWNGLE